MNLNASIYNNALDKMTNEFGVSKQKGRTGQMAFLIAYAIGCELWAPWSEEIGRKPILQASLFLVNLFQIPAALAPNFGTVVAARTLGGLSSAGGSVTLGMVADLYDKENQQHPVAFIVFSSVFGSVLGPIIGGFLEYYVVSWRWIFWAQLIFGVVTQIMHLFLVSESNPSTMLDQEAQRQRHKGEKPNLYGPNEVNGSLFERLTWVELWKIWSRPFHMLATEPIVLCLSLLSGFSDALIFTFLECWGMVFAQWDFNSWQVGLCFVGLAIGYVIGYVSFMPFFKRDKQTILKNKKLSPERRLYWLLYTAPLLPIGLIGFAWTSLGPQYVHWTIPLLFSIPIGIANYAIYMATIDYMVATYGRLAASATGGNGFARDLLAGVSAMYAVPFYQVFQTFTLEWPTTILSIISVLGIIPIYVFYFNGPAVRRRSRLAAPVSVPVSRAASPSPSSGTAVDEESLDV